MRRVASRFEISSGQKADLSELSKPDRTATAGWIFDDVRHDIKSIFVEERAVLQSIQAPMVKRLVFVGADCFSK